MDPVEYLSFASATLVSDSHKSRIVSLSGKRRFSLFFGNALFGSEMEGNSHSFFSGRIILGPRWEGLALSLSALVVYGLQILSVSGNNPLLIALLGISLVLMFLTALSNPGIVPREHLEPVGEDIRVDSTTGLLVPRYLLLNGVCVRQKFCRTCKIYRPPRSNHCSVCDNCVLKFDHHCAALSTCIGLGNYRWFLLLIAALTVLQPAVFWLVWSQIGPLSLANLNLVFLLVASGGAFLAFSLLLVYHVFITAHNLTTNEHLKKYYKVNPFDYGLIANFKHCLCFPQTLLPVKESPQIAASYRELASTNSECISDFYDY